MTFRSGRRRKARHRGRKQLCLGLKEGDEMTPEVAIGMGREALFLALLVSAPILGLGLLVGVSVSIFQAVTSIQEMTLTFIPKVLVGALAGLVFGPWMLMHLMNFTIKIFTSIPQFAK